MRARATVIVTLIAITALAHAYELPGTFAPMNAAVEQDSPLTSPEAREVLKFWRAAGPGLWFAKHEAFDARFRERFLVQRFGRFPHRNRILGRETTPEEQKYLDNGGYQG